jgi:hypothetical protein
MKRMRGALILIACFAAAQAAPSQAPAGAIVIKAKNIKGADKARSILARKRFYLFSGSLKDNQPLIDRIKAADIVSRDCYYSGVGASGCFIAWLKQENCESPFCRPVKQEDIARVPEFKTAYDKGLVSYAKRPDLALSWIIDTLPAPLSIGFYRQEHSVIDKILGTQKPLQSIMSTSTAVEATFVGIAAGAKPTKFTISNVLPVEIDNKSYVWTCEVDVTAAKTTALPLTMDASKKNCVIVTKDLKTCSTGGCAAK